MLKQFRDLFGSKEATLAALAEIRDRIERIETTPAPDLPSDVHSRLTALSRRDGELQTDLADVQDNHRDLVEHIDGLDHWRKEIVIAVSEGIERTDRAERRIKATVQRARKQLETLGYDDPGLEAEAAELRLIDGDGSPKGEVPTVPTPVEEPASASSSVRGVPAETMRRARGF